MTDFSVGKKYHGFVLERKENIKEIESDVYLFRHELLNTPLMAIKNSDVNKTFCIGFNTVPEDSTGVAHILEHSVLMGSRKYPVKDVFGEINKGGLMTFLNAMTGGDTTWYPFATRNMKEYFNIMDVYCDVVFNPLLEKTTFEQEGWHYHLEEIGQPLQFQGVVYNEMKGAFSDPFRHLYHHIFNGLMPGSTYAHESGGDPECIPDLTYEDFVAFHKKHYHPSNSMIFFYGDADLDEELAFVEDNFLSAYDEAEDKAVIVAGDKPDEMVFIDETYGVQPGSEMEGKTFIAVGTLAGDSKNRKLTTTLQVIANILFNSDASLLKNRIIDSGICSDFGGFYVTNAACNNFMLTFLIGSDADKRERFLEIYRQSLVDMVEGGLDKDLVLSELNKYEFSVREERNKAQLGLDLVSRALMAIRYDDDPFKALQIEDVFAEIREDALNNGLFEQVIKDYLLDNPSSALVTLKPDSEKMARSREKEEHRLSAHAAEIGEEGLQAIVERTKELMALQMETNDEKTLQLLPSLTISDLNPKPEFSQAEVIAMEGMELIVCKENTNGIVYCDLGFACDSLTPSLLSILDIFATIVCEIGTEDMDFRETAKQINIYTGGLNSSFATYTGCDFVDNIRPVIWFKSKVLGNYLEQGMELVFKIISQVSFHDRQRIKDIVMREFSWAEHNIQSDGYGLASTRVFANLGISGQYNEAVNGATAYLRLRDLASNYDREEENFIARLEELKILLMRKDNLLASLICREEEVAEAGRLLSGFARSLPAGSGGSNIAEFPSLPRRTGFATSAEVVYNVQGGRIFDRQEEYNGYFEVLKTWVARDYLWNTVRQMGGAYGCFLRFSHFTGNLVIVSYRDPQIEKTFAAYDNLWQVVEKLELSKSGLNQLIIGAYGSYLPHQGPAGRGTTARDDYLTNVTPEFRKNIVQEIIDCKEDNLSAFAANLKRITEQQIIATIGNGSLIEAEKERYDEIVNL